MYFCTNLDMERSCKLLHFSLRFREDTCYSGISLVWESTTLRTIRRLNAAIHLPRRFITRSRTTREKREKLFCPRFRKIFKLVSPLKCNYFFFLPIRVVLNLRFFFSMQQTHNSYPEHVKSSGYRIVRVVDTDGHIHAARENTKTEFSCPRQGYFVHPKSCNR